MVAEGGAGGEEFAEVILDVLERKQRTSNPSTGTCPFTRYGIYGADGVVYTDKANGLSAASRSWVRQSPGVRSKDSTLHFRQPCVKTLTITDVRPSLALCCLPADIMTMPGLPETRSEMVDIDAEGRITGLF